MTDEYWASSADYAQQEEEYSYVTSAQVVQEEEEWEYATEKMLDDLQRAADINSEIG